MRLICEKEGAEGSDVAGPQTWKGCQVSELRDGSRACVEINQGRGVKSFPTSNAQCYKSRHMCSGVILQTSACDEKHITPI